jgi:hypothetical protein
MMSMVHLFVSMPAPYTSLINIYLNRIYYLLLSMNQAAQAGDTADVTRRLDSGEDVNQTDGVSVLSVATFNCAPQSALMLIVSVEFRKEILDETSCYVY